MRRCFLTLWTEFAACAVLLRHVFVCNQAPDKMSACNGLAINWFSMVCEMIHIATQNDPFRMVKWVVSLCDMG